MCHEAATERTFSSEAAIHTAARNRMATAKVQNRTKIRWNFEPIGQFALQAEELTEELIRRMSSRLGKGCVQFVLGALAGPGAGAAQKAIKRLRHR